MILRRWFDAQGTAGVVKAQHLPAPDAVLAEVEFPKGMGSNPGAAAAELLATGSRSDTSTKVLGTIGVL